MADLSLSELFKRSMDDYAKVMVENLLGDLYRMDLMTGRNPDTGRANGQWNRFGKGLRLPGHRIDALPGQIRHLRRETKRRATNVVLSIRGAEDELFL